MSVRRKAKSVLTKVASLESESILLKLILRKKKLGPEVKVL